jgi:hypothetical protein
MELHMDVKVSNYDGDVGELAKKYSPGFILIPFGNPNVKKYGFQARDENGSRLVMLSRCDLQFEGKDYNIMLTVHGTNADQVTKQTTDLEKRLGIELRDAPEHIIKTQESIAKMLKPLFS